MWLFYLKKSFCDGWDNMFALVAVNAIVFIPLAALAALMLTAIASGAMLLMLAFFFLLSAIFFITAFAFGDSAAKAANFSGWKVRDVLRNIPHSIADGLLFALIVTALLIVISICLPFYFSRHSLISVAVGIMFVWLVLFALLSLQWFSAVRTLLPGTFGKQIKKCFILFFDNTAFSIFLAFYTLIMTVFSCLFFGLLPSVSGITLAQVNALRLILYKYDYLDAHPEYQSRKQRKIIPWQELLAADREALGPRSFKSFIFPWKE